MIDETVRNNSMNCDASEELDNQLSSAEVKAPDFSKRKEPRGKLYCYNWDIRHLPPPISPFYVLNFTIPSNTK